MDEHVITFENVTPSSAEVSHDSVIDCWLQVERFFNDHSIKSFTKEPINIKIDSSKIRHVLYQLKPENCAEYLSNLFLHSEEQNHGNNTAKAFKADLIIWLIGKPKNSDWNLGIFLSNFLEMLFIAMNIAVRGGCNYYFAHAKGKMRSQKFDCHAIESGWHAASMDQWPKLMEIPFSAVWLWLERNDSFWYLLAETPVNKAIAVLSHLSQKDDIEATDIIQISHVLESFYLNKEEPKARSLSRKIPVVLGSLPNKGGRWISDLYNLRSDIAHGDFPIFRPSYKEVDEHFDAVSGQYWKVSNAINRGVSIILATIQNLIVSNADHYVFSEKIVVEAIVKK